MTDQELRDKLASEYAIIKFPVQNIQTTGEFTQDINFARRMTHGESFKAGWDAARANGHSAYQPMYPELSEQIDQLRIELADEREALNVLRSANRLNIEERDQLRAEVERYRLAERLPPRPKCPDCGVESLTGNVHDEHCFNWSNLVEERDAARAEVERLQQALSYLPKVPTEPYEKELAREIDRLKQALAVAKKALAECVELVEDANQINRSLHNPAKEALAEIEKLEKGE